MRIYYSDGFGTNGSDDRANVERFLAQRSASTDIENQIHAVWYFLDCTDEEIPASEKEFFGLDFGEIPVLVVLKNEERLKDSIREDLVDEEFGKDLQTWKKFDEIIKKKKKEMEGLKKKTFVHARNRKFFFRFSCAAN